MASPHFTAITRERFEGKKWQRFSSYRFASADTMAPIVSAELARAALALPLAFSQEAGHFALVAVLSLTPDRNMLVGPDGRWLGNYIPAFYRGYPFRLLPTREAGKLGLFIEADGGAVEGNSAAEDFFDQNGSLSPALSKVFEFLSEFERNRHGTRLAVSALAEAGVIRPWPIRIKAGKDEREVGGLFLIDEAALNGLSDDAFLKLRKSSALPIAYAQILSIPLISVFEQLARAELSPQPTAALPESLDSLFGMSSDDLIKFQ